MRDLASDLANGREDNVTTSMSAAMRQGTKNLSESLFAGPPPHNARIETPCPETIAKTTAKNMAFTRKRRAADRVPPKKYDPTNRRTDWNMPPRPAFQKGPFFMAIRTRPSRAHPI